MRLLRRIGQHQGLEPVKPAWVRLLLLCHRVDERVELVAIGRVVALEEEVLHGVGCNAVLGGELDCGFEHVTSSQQAF
jgi:hypothetical protein